MFERRKLIGLFMAVLMMALPLAVTTAPAMAQPGGGSLTTAIMQVIPGVGTFTGTLTYN